MKGFNEDIKVLKTHLKAVEEILKPYVLDRQALVLENEIIDGYKKIYAYKRKVFDVQNDIRVKLHEIDEIIKRYTNK